MSKMFNIENCDVTMENGCLRLIYHTDELLMPMTLAISKTYHDLNEKGMYLFGQEDWVGNVVEWSIRKESPIWHNLLADIYKNHHDLYSSIMVTPEDDEYDDDVDDNDKVLGYMTLEATGDIDEKTGHRIAHFNTADLEALDNGILHVLAEACGIKDGEYMFRDELINAMSQQDIDMDDCDYDCENCDCAEKISDGDVICHLDEDDDEEDDEEDLCDGDCDHCKSDAPATDSGCSCEIKTKMRHNPMSSRMSMWMVPLTIMALSASRICVSCLATRLSAGSVFAMPTSIVSVMVPSPV